MKKKLTKLMLVHCVRPTLWFDFFSSQKHGSFILYVKADRQGEELWDILQEHARRKFGEDAKVLCVADLG